MEGLRNGSLPKRWTCLSCCCCLFTACALRCCLKTRRSCSCHSPLIPRPNRRQEQKQAWRQAHNRNIRLAENASQQTDVVFLGDSITERFLGTDLEELRGRHRDKVQAFQELFTRAGGGTVDGVPLGISGDRSTALLYRLQHGELPRTLNPPVFWILVGTNDLGEECTPETISVGILRVVQEVWIHKPQSVIVISGLLP
mmetsp:Transcript_13690/g.31824  ORF Transcript_13690/g.31824 Transcript_13690/m.31824 type:complete len:199 (+) Transcript_13690:379-975(+)